MKKTRIFIAYSILREQPTIFHKDIYLHHDGSLHDIIIYAKLINIF